ncbi:hypothetical protein WDL1P1_00233 (plasmid) [Variovorax sp. WDL1]|nr:hypothetical protein WDL1P1_00233 [Variovorax sp. WDL1]
MASEERSESGDIEAKRLAGRKAETEQGLVRPRDSRLATISPMKSVAYGGLGRNEGLLYPEEPRLPLFLCLLVID